ncbi:MAG: zf-HC2 domain-containing protein [Candidatus Omnitrophica bacterium]|nr:zf-HC2 domain-containing protein [Candidatus Omnitrophota bacterium]
MDCSQTHRNLYPYLDRQIEPAKKKSFESHLGECPDCYGCYRFHFHLRDCLKKIYRHFELPPSVLRCLFKRVAGGPP